MELAVGGSLIASLIAGELLAAVKDVAVKNTNFKDCCQKLKGTLEGLIPTLEKVVNNQLTDYQQKLLKEFCEKLMVGKELLQKCSKVKQLDIVHIYKYAKKIERFDQDVGQFIRTIHEINYGRTNLGVKVDDMRDKLEKYENGMPEMLRRMMKDFRDQLENGESASPSSIPKLPDCSDGLAISLADLKKPLLLYQDVQLLGELGMGSSSNTTLETAFCNDVEFQGAMRRNPARQFDVFINHRGKDVKNSLASNIYYQLKYKDPTLRVFLDKKEIPYGVDFPFAIETAIQSSSVYIAIFSEGYAESKWCLHELDLIIESKRKLIPVFCDVNPADLRRIEKGCYRTAFEKHRGREPLEKTKRWEDALARASYLQGLPFKMKETNHWKFGEKIVSIVLMNLKEGSSIDDKYPVAPGQGAEELPGSATELEDLGLCQEFVTEESAVAAEADEDRRDLSELCQTYEGGPPISRLFERDEEAV